MTYYSEIKLICDGICATDSFKNIIGINATIITRYRLKNDTICGICDTNCQNAEFTDGEFIKLKSLCEKTNGRILVLCPDDRMFIYHPILYKSEIVALLKIGPISVKDDFSVFDIKKVWSLSAVGASFAKGLSVTQNTSFAGPDYFDKLENNLLMDLRLKNFEDFKAKIDEMLYDISLKMANDIFSAKALSLTVIMLILKIATDNQLNIKAIFGKDFVSLKKFKNLKYESQIDDLLSHLAKNFTSAIFGKTSSRHLAITDAVSYIENHYSEKLTLDSVASKIFMSPHYLSKAFLSETGTKFSVFLNNTRIEKAKILLENDKLDLKEVANAVGFDDQSYFCKVFKKTTGISPKQYRIRMTVNL